MWPAGARPDRGGTEKNHLSRHQENTMSSTQYRRIVPILATTVLAVALGAVPASARQDMGPSTSPENFPYFHSIQRVGTQYTAGDDCTGNGVPAPGWVDER